MLNGTVCVLYGNACDKHTWRWDVSAFLSVMMHPKDQCCN